MSDNQITYLLDAIQRLTDKRDETVEKLYELGESLARVEQAMTSLPDLHARLRAVEEIAQQAKGAKWTLGALMTGAAFLGGGIGAKLVGLFTQSK